MSQEIRANVRTKESLVAQSISAGYRELCTSPAQRTLPTYNVIMALMPAEKSSIVLSFLSLRIKKAKPERQFSE